MLHSKVTLFAEPSRYRDLSTTEAGRMTIERIEVPVGELLLELKSLMEPHATLKGLALKFITLGILPQMIVSDPTLIRRVLIDVIGNAIRLTEAGAVTVTTLFESAQEKDRLRIVISDTGAGLTPSKVECLFESFEPDAATGLSRTGGCLALSAQLAGALGGWLKLRSTTPHGGSCFEFILPTGVSVQKLSTQAISLFPGADNQERLDNVHVLLVEDSPDNQVLITRFLQMAGAQVDLAVNGLEAVQMAMSGFYEIVLMDIQMPLLDGYEATSRLRALGYHRPIVALTAHAMKEERERCLNVGCNAHLTKPIGRQHLVSALQGYVDQRTSLCSH